MSKKLKAGLIGVGSMGRGHLDNYVKLLKEDSDIELVALCDIDEKKFTNYKADFNLGPVGEDGYDFDRFRLYTDLDDLLENESLDMVTIALPTYLHAWATVKCLDKGINVLCEKPMATTYEDCLRMIEASERNGKFLMIGQCLRFATPYLALKSMWTKSCWASAWPRISSAAAARRCGRIRTGCLTAKRAAARCSTSISTTWTR